MMPHVHLIPGIFTVISLSYNFGLQFHVALESGSVFLCVSKSKYDIKKNVQLLSSNNYFYEDPSKKCMCQIYIRI